MSDKLRGWFLDRPLNQKLVLIFSIPVLFLVTLSIFTVLVFKKFEAAEDMLERSIFIRGQAIYYLERLYFVQNAFRGYLLTGDRSFVIHYNEAKHDIDLAGLELARLVKDSSVQSHGDTVANMRTATRQLLREKDAVIARIETGAQGEGLAYIESGRGLDLVDRISTLLDRFQSAEAQLQKDRQAAVEEQRDLVIWVIVGEGFVILLLCGLGVAMVARSVTQPMSALAAAATKIGQPDPVTFPDANRLDEVGLLSRSMAEMDRQIRAQITDLKQSEAILRELSENLFLSELRYRSLVEHAPLGIFTTTSQAWTFANPFECELMGLPAGVTPSFEHWRDALHPDDVDRVTREFRSSVEQEIPFESEFRFVRPDGSVRHILSRGIPVQKSPVGGGFYLCLDLDVSQMVELQERLAPAERLATLTRMATSIAHDLRTPLLGLEQGLQGLKYVAAHQLDPNSKQLLEDLHTGARLAVGIVQDILDLYRQAYGDLPLSYSTFQLDDVVREVIELMAAEVRDRRLSIVIQGEGHEVWADRRRLFRVMVNLLDNAVKNSPAGGRVTVVLTGQDTRLSVAVEDEGRGFEASAMDKIFEPSRLSSTPTRGGTGLGLYLCRLVIGAHEGTITAENRREGGARFTFNIPIDRRKGANGYLHFDRRRPAPVQAQPEDGA